MKLKRNFIFLLLKFFMMIFLVVAPGIFNVPLDRATEKLDFLSLALMLSDFVLLLH